MWRGRQDPPVSLDWTSNKIKVLRVFIGCINLDEDNWSPRIDAVENVLSSWARCILSYGGKALVINALALSRVWYVASLIHMPGWVHSDMSQLIFKFFWKGKTDLVARVVVSQPTAAGGFSVVDIKSKVFSLLVQWVRRFSSSPSGWVSFFSYWCSVLLGKPASDVFACPSAFSTNFFPPFYRDLLVAWKKVDGFSSERRSSLISASSSPHHVSAVSCMTSQCVYSFLLSESRGDPHCVEKFLPLYGVLYWPTTWRQLFFFDLERPVIDLCWNIAHGVLFTADRLIGFGYSIDPTCFCGLASECLPHLFFSCPLAQSALSWLQFLMFCFSSLSPSLEFYVKFWPILGTDLVNVLNSCYLSGVRSLTQRRGLVSLIFKKGDHLDPRNWRPITLLNVDYKLAVRVVAGRLLKVIHLIVAKDQTCGVPGPFIGKNVSIIRDVVCFASRTGVPLAILSLIKRKRSIVWTGVLCVQTSVGWVLSIPFCSGLVFFIPKFRVPLLLMEISTLSFLCLEV